MQTTTFNLSVLSHFVAQQGNISGGATVTDQYGFLANNELTNATNNYGFFGNIPNGTNRWNIYMNGTADNYLRGKLLINTNTVGTFNLDVNGTARVSGAALFGSTSSFGGNMTLAVNQNDATTFQISNANSNASSVVVLNLVSSNGSASIGKRSNTTAVYRFLNVNDAYIYNSGNSGDIGILNDFASGSLKMGAGGSSTAHFTIKSNGRINMSSLPTSATGLSAGDIWNDGGTLKIV
jgi:hypothetical protein